MAKRRVVGNLIKPRPIPPFTAATTSSARWIDGTAGGSTTNDQYGWYAITGVGNVQYSITEDGVTLSITTNTGRGRVMTANFETTTSKQNVNQYGIEVFPNTSYTFTFRAKTVNNLANSGRGQVLLFDSSGTPAGGSTVVLQTGTTDWTDYSVNFTTGATSSRAVIRCIFETAGNIMSATFKDFKLDTTTPTTRTTATSRTTATNRVAVRDMGTALRFDGNDFITVTHQANLTDFTAMTLNLWCKKTVNNAVQMLATKRNGSNTRYELNYDATNLIRFAVGNGTTFAESVIPVAITDKNWYLITGVYDGSSVRIYVNGIQSGTTPALTGTVSTSTNNLFFGKREIGGATFLSGIIDEPRIWNRALTTTEIQNLYLNNIVPTDGLVAEYLFDEATGTTALDTSGNGNDGTITGATYTTDTPLRPRTSV